MLLTNVKSDHTLLRFVLMIFVLRLNTILSAPSKSTSSSNTDINNLLINDLNIIATKLDDIPETSLNLKLFLLAYECTDVKLTWKISNSNSHRTTTMNKNGELFHHPKSGPKRPESKIFGYQVVVREYLESKKSQTTTSTKSLNSEEIYEKQNEKTLRVYSSKFIEANQNKFKLINLLRRNMASYLICLIIYMDVTETVAFEKQCVNFSLPIVSKEFESFCDRNPAASGGAVSKTKQSKLNTFSSWEELSGKKLPMSKLRPNPTSSNEVDKLDTNHKHNMTLQLTRNSTSGPQSRTNGGGGSNCEHIAQCKHYSNLLVAFVVCGVLLGTNVFMFTIIIIQNTIKLGLLRHKLKIYKNTQSRLFTNLPNSSVSHFADGNRDLDDKSFLNSNSKLNKFDCSSFLFRTAVWESCSDIVRAVCCGAFRESGAGDTGTTKSQQPPGRKKKPNDLGKSHLDVMENIRNKFESFTSAHSNSNNHDYRPDSDTSSQSQSCTTITRPGYILQVPTISSTQPISASGVERPTPLRSNLSQSINETYSKSHSKVFNDLGPNSSEVYAVAKNHHHNPHKEKKKKKSSAATRVTTQMEIYGIENEQINVSQTEDELNRTGNTSCMLEKGEFRRSNLEAYENEIFYHVPNKLIGAPQVSSAF